LSEAPARIDAFQSMANPNKSLVSRGIIGICFAVVRPEPQEDSPNDTCIDEGGHGERIASPGRDDFGIDERQQVSDKRSLQLNARHDEVGRLVEEEFCKERRASSSARINENRSADSETGACTEGVRRLGLVDAEDDVRRELNDGRVPFGRQGFQELHRFVEAAESLHRFLAVEKARQTQASRRPPNGRWKGQIEGNAACEPWAQPPAIRCSERQTPGWSLPEPCIANGRPPIEVHQRLCGGEHELGLEEREQLCSIAVRDESIAERGRSK
jgi:hypothetical protein